jgi:hypothetical protein
MTSPDRPPVPAEAPRQVEVVYVYYDYWAALTATEGGKSGR